MSTTLESRLRRKKIITVSWDILGHSPELQSKLAGKLWSKKVGKLAFLLLSI